MRQNEMRPLILYNMELTKIKQSVIWKFQNGYSLSYEETVILRNVIERAKTEKQKAKSSNWLGFAGRAAAAIALGAIGIDAGDLFD
jgi:hypothetical protein